MSRGPGWVQRRVLEILNREPGKAWNAFGLAAEVYKIEPGDDGWIIPDAPAVAVRRVLLGLKRQGKVTCSRRYFDGCRHWQLLV